LSSDNCPGLHNPEQVDGDGDGLGDACEPCVPQPEICANGIDEDCDGWADNGCVAEEEGCGCQSATGSSGLVGMGLAVGLMGLRRRSRS
jgi:MYXO-CTERM domain-containing protein